MPSLPPHTHTHAISYTVLLWIAENAGDSQVDTRHVNLGSCKEMLGTNQSPPATDKTQPSIATLTSGKANWAVPEASN
jgi:hypothetical protein